MRQAMIDREKLVEQIHAAVFNTEHGLAAKPNKPVILAMVAGLATAVRPLLDELEDTEKHAADTDAQLEDLRRRLVALEVGRSGETTKGRRQSDAPRLKWD